LATFDITNGAYPYGTLVQGLDGNFYGTTAEGNGRNQCTGGCGEVFKITPEGTLSSVHNFDSTDGAYPYGGLVLAANGNFYGTTAGNVFELTNDGTFTVLANLGSGGSSHALVQDTIDGNFYGTESEAPGQVFQLTPGGTVTILYTFCRIKDNSKSGPYCADGSSPMASLLQGSDGFLYGTTLNGGDPGSDDCGTVFKIGTKGSLDVLHKFVGPEGCQPMAGLIQGTDGNFYGTTSSGSVFKMLPSGAATALYSFTESSGPHYPVAPLVQATDGNFYGTAKYGSSSACPSGCGAVFQLTPAGAFTIIHSFDKTDGGYPQAGLVQGTDGNLYGETTGFSGQHLYGTVFQLSMGLAPFVKTVPDAAYPGTTIFILGTDLTGATSVTFNGKAATFTVVSATEITAKVPTGSTTGTLQVVTPGGTLLSNIPFRVF
jgi:uncharacterized repeat protein (TIGR03803 family)